MVLNKENINKRNLIRQEITLSDGTKKNIFHEKRMPNSSYKDWWNAKNKMPKPNSKRQQKLREQSITV